MPLPTLPDALGGFGPIRRLGDLTPEAYRRLIEFILSLSKQSDPRFNHGGRLADLKIGALSQLCGEECAYWEGCFHHVVITWVLVYVFFSSQKYSEMPLSSYNVCLRAFPELSFDSD